MPCPPLDDGGPGRYARWGEQLDVRNITTDSDQAGELSAEQVAGYIAKYATKATESFGSRPRPAPTAPTTWTTSTSCPAHVAELVRAAWELGGRPELDGLRLRAWAHMLGFGGHWSTKSRRYSTTFTVLRRARVAFAKRRRARDGMPLDAWGRPEDDQAVIVVASWVYVGVRLCDRGGALAGPVGRRPGSRTATGGPGGADHHDRIALHDLAGEGRTPELDTLLTCRAGRRAAGHDACGSCAGWSFERRIAYVKVGRHVRIAEHDLADYVAAGRVEAERRAAGCVMSRRRVRERAPAAVWPLAGALPRPAGCQHTAPQTFATKTDATRYLAQVETDLHRGSGPTRGWAGSTFGGVG